MHEYSVTEELISLILEEVDKHSISCVNKVKVVLGKLTGFVSDSIKYYFDILKEEYEVLRNTEIEFQEIKGIFRCGECKTEYESDSYLVTCPVCGSFDYQVLKGEEFFIEYMEVD